MHRSVKLPYGSEIEIKFLFDIIKQNGCARLLEVGSKTGRMLWRWGEFLPPGSLICSIDDAEDSGCYNSLVEIIQILRGKKFEVHSFIGDSHSKRAVAWAKDLAPFDFVFIDGDHSHEGAKADWENYGGLAPIVGFHDISKDIKLGVHKLYEKLCEDLSHKELIEKTHSSGHAPTPGIGIIWNA